MKMEGWAERIGVGLVGLVLGLIVTGVLALAFDLWYWPMLAIAPVCMILAMLIGDPIVNFLKGFLEFVSRIWW